MAWVAMHKIASPQELQSELRRLLAYCSGPEKPSRVKLAAELSHLADRVAETSAEDTDTFTPKRQHKSLGNKMYGSGLFMPPSKRFLKDVANALMDGKPVSRKKIQEAVEEVDKQSKEPGKDDQEKRTLENLRDELKRL